METLRIKGPTWFPDYLKSCVEGILLLKEIPTEGGIFFVKYPKNLSEEISNLLKAFFTLKNCAFVKFNDDLKLFDNVNQDISNFIKETSFVTGPSEYSFKLIERSDKECKIEMLRNGVTFPINNPSHKTVLQSIFASDLLLKENINVVCFQMDTECLDLETNKVIYKIFNHINDKIKNSGKHLIVFYSDSTHEFAHEYLWRDSIYNSFAIIDSHLSYRIKNYKDSIREINEALKQNKFERLDLFLGAGASIESGMPGGRTLRLIALKELTNSPTIEDDEILLKKALTIIPENLHMDVSKITLEYVMSLLQISGKQNLCQSDVMKYFEERHDSAEKNPSSGYILLKELAEKGITILAVTTNFDQLLDISLPNPKIIIQDDQFESEDFHSIVRGEKGSTIVKLHGSRSYPNTLGIQIQNNMELPGPKKEFLKAFISSSRSEGPPISVFFIGYNFADLDITEAITSNLGYLRIRPIIVSPEMTPSIQTFIKKFENVPAQATFIPFTFDFFMEKIFEIFQQNQMKN